MYLAELLAKMKGEICVNLTKKILKDWKARFHWGFKEEDFPGNSSFFVLYFVFLMVLNNFEVNGEQMGKLVFIAIFLLVIIVCIKLNLMFGKKLPTIYYVIPMTREEKKDYLRRNYWLKVIIFSLIHLLFAMFGMMIGYINIKGLVLISISMYCLQMIVGLGREKEKDSMQIVALCISLGIALAEFDYSFQGYSYLGEKEATVGLALLVVGTVIWTWLKYKKLLVWPNYEEV